MVIKVLIIRDNKNYYHIMIISKYYFNKVITIITIITFHFNILAPIHLHNEEVNIVVNSPILKQGSVDQYPAE